MAILIMNVNGATIVRLSALYNMFFSVYVFMSRDMLYNWMLSENSYINCFITGSD